MNQITRMVESAPSSVKVASDIGVWGVAVAGWLNTFQPWLTALATVLAIGWTSLQIYTAVKHRKKRK